MLSKKIAQHLRTFRATKGLLQKEVSDMLIVSSERISYLESGKANPTLQTLLELAIIMDMELKKLLE